MSETRPVFSFLELALISRVRRNHALEHATMHVLGERHRDLRLVGHSSPRGFAIYGSIPAEWVAAAAQEGLRRLRAGDRRMAVHPNCGSNLAVAGVLAGLGAFLALGGLSGKQPKRFLDRLTRLPVACAAAVLGIVLAQPLGTALQSHVTTRAEIGELRIASITQERRAGILVHHVRTEG